MSLADAVPFLRLTNHLVRIKDPTTSAELQSTLKISRSTLYRILGFYRYHAAIDYERSKIQVDKNKVITLAAGLRADRAVPDLVIERGPPSKAALADLTSRGIHVVLGFTTAANLHSYFEPSGAVSLYVPKAHRTTATKILRSKGPTTYHVRVERLETLPTEELSDGTVLTDPVQTLLDLTSDPRGGAHAAFLREVLKRKGIL